jgi:hypothetical protein
MQIKSVFPVAVLGQFTLIKDYPEPAFVSFGVIAPGFKLTYARLAC